MDDLSCQKIHDGFYCQCSVCAFQAKERPAEWTFLKVNPTYKAVSFTWILEKLGQVSSSYKVLISIPETAVFANGKPAYILAQTREKSLALITSPDKLNPAEIIKSFMSIVRNRKKETILSTKTLISNILAKYILVKKVFNDSKEAALIRYFDPKGRSEDGPFQVFNENEFTELMWERPGSKAWAKVVYMQTLLKTRKGLGMPIYYQYTAKASSRIRESAQKRISSFYDQSLSMLETENLGRILKGEQLYEAVCQRIAYFIALGADYEIMQMEVEFLQDFNGRLWVVYIQNIGVQKLNLHTYKDNRVAIVRKTPPLQARVELNRSPLVNKTMERLDSHLKKMGIHIADPNYNESFREKHNRTAVKQSPTPLKMKAASMRTLRKNFTPSTSLPKLTWKYNPRVPIRLQTRPRETDFFKGIHIS